MADLRTGHAALEAQLLCASAKLACGDPEAQAGGVRI